LSPLGTVPVVNPRFAFFFPPPPCKSPRRALSWTRFPKGAPNVSLSNLASVFQCNPLLKWARLQNRQLLRVNVSRYGSSFWLGWGGTIPSLQTFSLLGRALGSGPGSPFSCCSFPHYASSHYSTFSRPDGSVLFLSRSSLFFHIRTRFRPVLAFSLDSINIGPPFHFPPLLIWALPNPFRDGVRHRPGFSPPRCVPPLNFLGSPFPSSLNRRTHALNSPAL